MMRTEGMIKPEDDIKPMFHITHDHFAAILENVQVERDLTASAR